MKKQLTLIGLILLMNSGSLFAQNDTRPEKCGMRQYHKALIAKDPSWAQKLDDQVNSLHAAAEFYMQYKAQAANERTTSTISAVPVIFHIVVDSAQFNALGGTTGIEIRIDSQITVLNHDYNRENSDSTLIPSGWKALYGTPGIHFGLAHVDPSGNCSPGYEVKIIAGTNLNDAGFDDVDNAFPEAKTAGTGLPAWDVTKYYNVWCINFTGGATGLLGLTVPLSSTGTCGFCTPVDQEGVCMLYNVLGSTGPTNVPPPGTGGSTGWLLPYNLGRTLTHETGHMFEIWHPWGDDGGQCPTWSTDTTVGGVTCVAGIGMDDGLDDTPPESNWVYGNPAYTIPGGTWNDCCMMDGSVNTQPIGIACLSYMDYTDDDAMHMFTTEQAAAMASMVLVPPSSATGATGYGQVGENYNLTQNPGLLVCPATGIGSLPTEINSSLTIYPNPTVGEVTISVNTKTETLKEIIISNIYGQVVMTVTGQGKDYYNVDLSAMSKGVYFVKCNFESGSVTRKLELE